jgi:hypothetical protein
VGDGEVIKMLLKRRHAWVFVAGALLGAACSEHEGDDHAGHGSAGAGPVSTTTVEAPVLGELMPMGGALHVMWTNKSACDTIEGERKAGEGEFSLAFSVPGEADNKHDSAATGDQMYTYRLRCKKGDTLSPYSNELSRNPSK